MSPGEPKPDAPLAGLRAEYASRLGSGYQLWNTEPYIERVAPLAERIQLAHQNGKVYRRRIIVVEDWTEVDAP